MSVEQLPKLQVLVYDDKGSCSSSADALVLQLRRLLDDSMIVQKVNSVDLVSKQWEDKTALLVMGGGVCSQWENNLGEEGLLKIHRYVVEGGKYLGLCAGAYFVSKESFFQLRNQEPITKKRSLFFFDGKAIGPLCDTKDALAPKSALTPAVCFTWGEKAQQGRLYYQGGCYFNNAPAASVVGTYEELTLPAAVLCQVGKGSAFLSGLHPEFEWSEELTRNSSEKHRVLAGILFPHEDFRNLLWQEIGRSLSLPCK